MGVSVCRVFAAFAAINDDCGAGTQLDRMAVRYRLHLLYCTQEGTENFIPSIKQTTRHQLK